MNCKFPRLIAILGSLALMFPTLKAAEVPQTVRLLNGKDLTGWKQVGGKGTNQWRFGRAAVDSADPTKLTVAGPGEELISPKPGVNLSTATDFKDCHLELEFMIPKASNSGVKMMNIYEIQILDSYGKEPAGKGDCGAIYKESAPRVNAAKPAGEWQTLVIDFQGPRFDTAGNKTANAKFVRVVLNGQIVQENIEVEHGTNVGTNRTEHASGPIYLQGDHGPVAFRNMKIMPLN
jgi:hypothetical protein